MYKLVLLIFFVLSNISNSKNATWVLRLHLHVMIVIDVVQEVVQQEEVQNF